MLHVVEAADGEDGAGIEGQRRLEEVQPRRAREPIGVRGDLEQRGCDPRGRC